MAAMMAFLSRIQQAVSMMHPADILDILLVAFLIYRLLTVSHSRTAGRILEAIAILLVLSYVSTVAGLNMVNYIVSKALEFGIIALVVVFQPELRRVLEKFGNRPFRDIFTRKPVSEDTIRTIDQTVAACRTMSRQKIGALIVFERENDLESYFSTGTVVDAQVSADLLKNIFFPKASLHDGAVVIRSDRIAAAGCVLPLTDDPNLSRDLGTRHRAAIGITEHSDAVVVVVSEETGVISCVIGGVLQRYLTGDTLTALLKKSLIGEETEETERPSLLRFRRSKKGEGEE